LDEGVLGLIWKIHFNNCFYSQKDSYEHNNLYYRNKLRKKKIKFKKTKSKNIIAFNKKMSGLDIMSNNKDIYLFGETRTRHEWLNYCKKFGNDNITKYHKDIAHNNVIVYILGPFCEVMWLREKDSYIKLFRKTIKIFKEKFPNIKILIKPHITTDLSIVMNEIENNKQFDITNIHPSVLSYYAKCFVSNLYSTTFADAYNLGVYTVEFSDYSQNFLYCTSGESANPHYVDFFVNNDERKFAQSLQKIMVKNRKKIIAKQNVDDISGLLERLSK